MNEETTESEILTMANAFREVSETMRSVHRVFIRLAIGIPIILIAFMVLLTVIIVWVGWQAEKRMTERLNAMNINQTQNVNMPPDRNDFGQLLREKMEASGKIQRSPK